MKSFSFLFSILIFMMPFSGYSQEGIYTKIFAAPGDAVNALFFSERPKYYPPQPPEETYELSNQEKTKADTEYKAYLQLLEKNKAAADLKQKVIKEIQRLDGFESLTNNQTIKELGGKINFSICDAKGCVDSDNKIDPKNRGVINCFQRNAKQLARALQNPEYKKFLKDTGIKNFNFKMMGPKQSAPKISVQPENPNTETIYYYHDYQSVHLGWNVTSYKEELNTCLKSHLHTTKVSRDDDIYMDSTYGRCITFSGALTYSSSLCVDCFDSAYSMNVPIRGPGKGDGTLTIESSVKPDGTCVDAGPELISTLAIRTEMNKHLANSRQLSGASVSDSGVE